MPKANYKASYKLVYDTSNTDNVTIYDDESSYLDEVQLGCSERCIDLQDESDDDFNTTCALTLNDSDSDSLIVLNDDINQTYDSDVCILANDGILQSSAFNNCDNSDVKKTLDCGDTDGSSADPHVQAAVGSETDGNASIISINNENANVKGGNDAVVIVDGNKRSSSDLIWFCRVVTEWPITAFALGVLGHIFILATTILLMLLDQEVFPVEFGKLPTELYKQPWIKRDLAWTSRFNYPNKVDSIKTPDWPGKDEFDGLVIIFSAENENIFTRDNLKYIKMVEDTLTNLSNFSDFCQTSASGACEPWSSVLRLFDGSAAQINSEFNDPNFINISRVLYAAFSHNVTKAKLLYALPRQYNITTKIANASMTRIYMPFTCSSIMVKQNISWSKAVSKYNHFLYDEVKSVLDELRENSTLEISYYSRLLFEYDVKNQALKDVKLAIGSMSFIFCYMWFHTSSLWVTTWAVISILSSFLATNLFYRFILGFRYFGFFHVLSLFIILGIGADDLFVFYDTWKASGATDHPTLAHRLSATYRKSVMSMLVTSVTTMAAFASTATSPLLIMKSFGMFSAVLVVIDYISVIVFFPTVVIVYELKILKCFNYLCGKIEKLGIYSFQKSSIKSTPRLVTFFKDHVYGFITNKKISCVLLLGFVGMVALFSVYCSKLKPAGGHMALLKSDKTYQRALEQTVDNFVDSPITALDVYLVWGLEEQDMSTCSYYDYRCKGTQTFDDKFDPNSMESQITFQRLCEKMYSFSEKEIEKYRIQIDHTTGLPNIQCFARGIDQFMEKDISTDKIDGRLPWNLNKTRLVLNHRYPGILEKFPLNSTFHEYLNVAYNYWLISNYISDHPEDLNYYRGLMGQQEGPSSMEINKSPEVKVGNKFKFIAIKVKTTLNGFYLGYEEGIPIIESWENFMKEELSNMPKSLQGGFQVSPYNSWNWIFAQKEIQRNAIFGVLLGLGLTTLILIVFIQNIITSLLASFTMSLVTICVLGMIPMLGWNLGVLVSMNMCLLVGLSVDYVVHLAEGYTMSKFKERKSRVRDALESMGTSVFSGACTTLGASMFILFSQIMFFFQFGIFMLLTIGFSLLFSMLLFMTLLALIGPENHSGDLRIYLVKFHYFVFKRKRLSKN